MEPGETTHWHVDACHRISIVVRGDALGIEYRDSGDIKRIPVHAGKVSKNEPRPEVHRGVNVGEDPYEDVVIYFLDEPGMEPQPEAD